MSAPTPSERNRFVAGEVAATLLAHGVSGVVISPGSRNTPLVLAFERLSGFTLEVVLDERAAGFVALGMARATGKPAVLICTSGSAGAHYLPAVLEARYGRVPLIVLTADRPAELHHCGTGQTIGQARLFGESIRWFADLPAPSEDTPARWLCAVTTQGYAAATGSPAGPVHLNLAFRDPVWAEETHETAEALPLPGLLHPGLMRPQLMRGASSLGASDLRDLAEQMRGEPRGTLVCGPLAPATLDPTELADAMAGLAAVLDWPILGDAASGLRWGRHDQSHVMSAADAVLRHEPTAKRLRPSFALCFGQAPTSKAVQAWVGSAESAALVDPDGEWHEPQCRAQLLVVADPVLFCRQLTEILGASPRSTEQNAWCLGWRDASTRAAVVLAEQAGEGVWEARVAGAVLEALPEGAQLHVASSLAIRSVDSFTGTTERAIAVRANRGCNGIDGTLSTALGASLKWSAGPTAVLLGDLAFLHDLGGLEAACNLRAPLTAVVVQNGGGGIFDHLPISEHPTAFERFFITERKASISGLCEALGARHILVDEGDAISRAVAREIEKPVPSVIEVRVDRRDSLARHEQAWRAVANEFEGRPVGGEAPL